MVSINFFSMKKLYFLVFIVLALSCSKDIDKPSQSEVKVESRHTYWDKFQIISTCEAGSLTFRIDSECEESGYSDAIMEAINEYNNIPESSINLSVASSEEEAHLFFDCVQGTWCLGGNSSIPFDKNDLPGPNVITTFDSGGSIGGEIHLNINWEHCECTGESYVDCEYEDVPFSCLLKRTVMHEIGHSLGIAHNGQTFFGNPTHIEGTPDTTYDPESIFNDSDELSSRCDLCDAPCEFNANDIIAIQTLYPASPNLACECPELVDECDCEASIDIILPQTWESIGCVPPGSTIIVCAYGSSSEPKPDADISFSFSGSLEPNLFNSSTAKGCIEVSVGHSGGTISVFAENEDCGTNSTARVIEICETDEDGPTSGGLIDQL